MRSGQSRRRGMAIVIAMIITALVSMVAIIMSMISTSGMDMTRKRNAAIRTYYTAEGLAQMVHGEIDRLYRTEGGATESDLEAIQIPQFETYQAITEEGGPGLSVAASGDPAFELLTEGAYAGLYAYKQSYVIDATVAWAKPGVSLARAKQHRFYTMASVNENINALAIPLVQFMAFYDTDLEILPGPNMYLEGRVHTNANLYVGSHNNLEFSAGISAVGHIYRRRLDNPNMAMTGDIRIADANGVLRNLRNADGTWLDSSSPNWAEEAAQRFGGRVRSADHRVPQLRLPIDFSEKPRQILERASAADSEQLKSVKFENKAAIKIINGVAYGPNGNVIPLTYPNPSNPSQTKSIVSTRTWFDARENKTVRAIEINVGNLIESGLNIGGKVLYVDHSAASNELAAVRLTNGSRLPAGGLTVASPKPVYIRGDYNTVNKQVSLVAGDAVNILSNAWNDANGSYANRIASNTTVNTVVMTGKVSTQGSSYSGGFENVLRFSEQWSGKTLTYRGGIMCMWESEIAKGKWVYGSPVYTAPNRDWRYDTMYRNPANNPPGIPVVYAIETASYSHRY